MAIGHVILLWASLSTDCSLWLYVLFMIKAEFRRNAHCLSRESNAEYGLDVKPQRACPEVNIYCVAALENGITILLRAAPCHCKLQVTQRLHLVNRSALKNKSDLAIA